jgi:hypothetical protein
MQNAADAPAMAAATNSRNVTTPTREPRPSQKTSWSRKRHSPQIAAR